MICPIVPGGVIRACIHFFISRVKLVCLLIEPLFCVLTVTGITAVKKCEVIFDKSNDMILYFKMAQ